MADEHSFIKAVHRQLPTRIKVWKIIDPIHGGVSDVLYFGSRGRLLFVEYKHTQTLPKRCTSTIAKGKLSTLQVDWHVDLHEREIPIAAICGCHEPYGGVWMEEDREVEEGITKNEFLNRLQSVKELATRITTAVLGDSVDLTKESYDGQHQ